MELVATSSAAKRAALQTLVDPDAPSAQRALAVLRGEASGVSWLDAGAPTARGVVHERSFGLTFFLGHQSMGELVAMLQWTRETVAAEATSAAKPLPSEGHTHVEMWDGDPRIERMPEPTVFGRSVVFDGGHRTSALPALPSGLSLVPVDADLFQRAEWRQDQIDIFGSETSFFEHGWGRFLMRGDRILCETYAEFRADGRWEVGVVTREGERGNGYAHLTCSHLLAELEGRGYEAIWHAAESNEASLALARKLGFRRERHGPLFCYEPPTGVTPQS